MKIVSLFGEGVANNNYSVTRQRRLNCYYEVRKDGDKSKVVVYGTPGLVFQFSTTGQVIRALQGTETSLYIVSSNTFYSISPIGGILYSATITTSIGTCSIAYSPSQVVLVDGMNGYLYDGSSLTQISSGGFPNGAKTVTFFSGFFVAEQPGSQKFWVSNAFDGTTWNSLAFASASQDSDNILAVDHSIGNLVIFCQRHMEFWQNVGTSPQPFAPILGSANNFGLASIFSRVQIDGSIYFLARNQAGGVQVCSVTGYQPSVISNSDIDSIIARFTTVNDAVGLSYQQGSHKFYQLTFPSEDRSFLYDVTTGMWGETQTGITTKVAKRHMAQFATYYSGSNLVCDSTTSSIYKFDNNTYTDNGTTIVREIITKHSSNNFNEFTVDEVYLDMESGIGLKTGQGSDPQIMFQVSRDNGHTWENERWVNIGKIGQYVRAIWRRIGSSRDFVFRFRMTDPVKFVVNGGAMSVRMRKQ